MGAITAQSPLGSSQWPIKGKCSSLPLYLLVTAVVIQGLLIHRLLLQTASLQQQQHEEQPQLHDNDCALCRSMEQAAPPPQPIDSQVVIPCNITSTATTSLPPLRPPTSTTTSAPQQPQKHHRFLPYHEVASILRGAVRQDELQHYDGRRFHNSYPSYPDAQRWNVPGRQLCRETCCVQAVALALQASDDKLINTEDGKDLGDVLIRHLLDRQPHLHYFGTSLHPDMIPCLLPGTIIHVDNYREPVKYFWHTLRPLIKVPFVLMTTGTDANSPHLFPAYLDDPLLIAWYGTNPHGRNHAKLRPMHLGLSYQHPQSKFLTPYFRTNLGRHPFEDLDRFNLDKYPLDWDKDVFIHFGLRRPHRQKLWAFLCATPPPPRNNLTRISCHQETNQLSTSEIYEDMSRYRFGISPSGRGWDTYRTYELLLLGVIPLIPERIPDSHQLFQDLPVIHMPNLDHATTKEEFRVQIEAYVKSPAFRALNISKGWERLVTGHQRRQLLADTGRDAEIIVNQQGQEFFQGYKYIRTRGPTNYVFCDKTPKDCPFQEVRRLRKWTRPTFEEADSQYLRRWWQLSQDYNNPEWKASKLSQLYPTMTDDA